MRPQKNSRENFFKQWEQFFETMVTVCPNNAHCLGVMIRLYFSATSKQKLSGRKLIAYLLSHITATGTACLWEISVKDTVTSAVLATGVKKKSLPPSF